MKIIHICAGWEPMNGAAVVARFIAAEQRSAGNEVAFGSWVSPFKLRSADEVWIHCGWKPCLWWATLWSRKSIRVSAGCYDPIRLSYHGWKKILVRPIERWCLRRAARVVGTCAAESAWNESYEPSLSGRTETLDVKRYYKLNVPVKPLMADHPLHVLYLGRRHPLKGVQYLELAVAKLSVDLRIVGDHFGEELERDWGWCDVLCLPTLSENFGLVVAEALERGKRVITTDGAPAWKGQPGVTYLEGFRDGTEEKRVKLLTEALNFCPHSGV